MAGGELIWEAPGPGVWWLTPQHFPLPVSRFFADLFPRVTVGWEHGAERYGLPGGGGRFATVNAWFYFSPARPDPATFERREAAAKETLASARWRGEVGEWFERDRPRLVEANLALQRQPLRALDDAALAAQLTRAVEHFVASAPLHFAPSGFPIAAGRLLGAATQWRLELSDLAPLLAGSSPGSRRPLEHLDTIVATLRGLGATELSTLEEARDASPRAAAAIDDYLEEFGWRSIDGHDLAGMTLIERPDLLLTSLRAHADSKRRPELPDPTPLRERVPAAERQRFDELLADVRRSYQINDDNVGVSFGWPLGLVRRALLEVGGRLVERGRIADTGHVFETDSHEAPALLAGAGPSAEELAARAELRERAARAQPPAQLGEPLPDRPGVELPPTMAHLAKLRQDFWAAAGSRARDHLHGIGIGLGVHRGRACVAVELGDAFELEPGGVLIASMTTAAHNSVFPIAGAVATEQGGLFSHTAVLSRELGIPAVVGARGLLASIATGDLVEVDAREGVVRIVERRS